MKLDMANFTLAITKPEIIANSVEIERKKFADYLAITPGIFQMNNVLNKIMSLLPFRRLRNHKKVAFKTFRHFRHCESRKL